MNKSHAFIEFNDIESSKKCIDSQGFWSEQATPYNLIKVSKSNRESIEYEQKPAF